MNEENKNELENQDVTAGDIVDGAEVKDEVKETDEVVNEEPEKESEGTQEEVQEGSEEDRTPDEKDREEQQDAEPEKAESEGSPKDDKDELQDAEKEGQGNEETPESDKQDSEESPVSTEDEEKNKLLAELEELRAKQQDEENLKNLEKVKQQASMVCNKVLSDLHAKVETEFDKYGIDKTKTLEEIQKDAPAKAAMAQRIVAEAMQIKDAVERQAMSQTRDAFAQAVFTKAERLFDKYEMSQEQQEVAANTFLDIMFEAGIVNLDGDLEAKVKLAVGAAKLQHPDKPQPANEEESRTEAQEPETEKVEVEEPAKEEPKQEPVVNTADALDELKEGAGEGKQSTPADVVAIENVLTKLEALPFKARSAFYAAHADLINKAMQNTRLRVANKVDKNE